MNQLCNIGGWNRLVLSAFLFIFFSGSQAESVFARNHSESRLFPENGLTAYVDFWEEIFTRYNRNQVLIHDRYEVYLVYEVSQLEGDPTRSSRAQKFQKKQIKKHLKKWKTVLELISAKLRKKKSLNSHEKVLLSNIRTTLKRSLNWQDVKELSQRLHAQRGIRDVFVNGWIRSGRYIHHMREIFETERVPVEILALPFFESSFQLGSVSRKGATGLWQFIRSTGRHYLSINRYMDERLDPLHSTRGAALFLKKAYKKLDSWPLAVMAYNHGVNGISRAKGRLGNEPMRIIQSYSSRKFGYASRNYYPEFLATLRILRDPEQYFGGIVCEKNWQFRETVLPKKTQVNTVLKRYKMERNIFLEYNPSVRKRYAHSNFRLPAGYRLRLPPVDSDPRTSAARHNVATLSSEGGENSSKNDSDSGTTKGKKPVFHLVKRGETLYRISLKYGVSVSRLRKWNGLSGNLIHAGQKLIVQR